MEFQINQSQFDDIILEIDKILSNQNSSTFGLIWFPIILILITSLTNVISNVFISKSSFKLDTQKIKLETKLERIRQLYILLKRLRKITYSKIDKTKYCNYISKIRDFSNENKIIISENFFELSMEILDYFSILATDVSFKDVTKEKKLFSDFEKLYDTL